MRVAERGGGKAGARTRTGINESFLDENIVSLFWYIKKALGEKNIQLITSFMNERVGIVAVDRKRQAGRTDGRTGDRKGQQTNRPTTRPTREESR